MDSIVAYASTGSKLQKRFAQKNTKLLIQKGKQKIFSLDIVKSCNVTFAGIILWMVLLMRPFLTVMKVKGHANGRKIPK